jgi:hypothetical protein
VFQPGAGLYIAQLIAMLLSLGEVNPMTHTLTPNALKHSTVVAIKEQISSDLAGEAVILNLQSGIYFGLNEAGAKVWSLIQRPTSVQDLRDALLADYEVEPEVCERDLLQLLQDLQAAALIEVNHEETV